MSTYGDAERTEMLERLNAYLDGELSPDERRDVERRLADDARWSAELQRLQRAWDLLDRLPRAEVRTDFTQSTVEMIAVAEAEALTSQLRRPVRRAGFDLVLFAAGAVAAAAAGFLTIESIRPNRDDAVLRDLPVLEHFELYGKTEKGETAEFLRLLRNERLPPPPPPTMPRKHAG